jgi:hypothetical protein
MKQEVLVMATVKLADRVAVLEAEVARLKALLEEKEKPKQDWLDKVWGAFAGDPGHEEAVRLGREWRESFRPKPRKARKPRKS